MTIESIWRGKTNEKLSQRMVLNTVIKEKRPHVWRDRVVAAISRDAYAAVTNNPYQLPGLSRQRTTSHSHSRPPPAGCCSVPYFHVGTKAETEASTWSWGEGRKRCGSMPQGSWLLLASLRISLVKASQTAEPEGRGADRMILPQGSVCLGEAPILWNNAAKDAGRLFFFFFLETYQKSQTEVHCLAGE